MINRVRSASILLAFGFGALAYGIAFVAQPGCVPVHERLLEATSILTFSYPEPSGPCTGGSASVAAPSAGTSGAYAGVPPPEADVTLDPYWKAVATWLALAFGVAAVVGTLLELFPPVERAARWVWHGVRRVLFGRRPAVVVGLGWVGGPMALEMLDDGRPVVGVATDAGGTRAGEADRHGLRVFVGDARNPDLRGRLGLRYAREIVVAAGEDARNLDIASDLLSDVRALVRRGETAFGRLLWWRSRRPGTPLDLYVHVGDPTLLEAVLRHELFANAKDDVRVHPFSVRDLAARDLFLNPVNGIARVRSTTAAKAPRNGVPALPVPRTVPDPGGADGNGREVLHVLLFGFGTAGQAVALATARYAHFANGLRTRLTVLTSDPETEWDRFLRRHPAFSPPDLDLASGWFLRAGDEWTARPGRPALADRRCDTAVSLVPLPDLPNERVITDDATRLNAMTVTPVEYAVNAEVRPLPDGPPDADFARDLLHRLRPPTGPRVRAAAVVCLDDDRVSFETALALRDALAASSVLPPKSERVDLPIYVYLPQEEGLATLAATLDAERSVERGADGKLKDPHAMPRRERLPLVPYGLQRDVSSYDVVAALGVRERAKHVTRSHHNATGRIGGEHPEFARSDHLAAEHAVVKLDTLGVSRKRENPTEPTAKDLKAMAMMEHNRYMGERLAAGWQLGDRCNVRRQRVTFIPWDQLSPEEKDIDRDQVVAVLSERAPVRPADTLKPDTAEPNPVSAP